MKPEEYVQLKAFARQDGAFLSLALIGGFALYIMGLSNPTLSLAALVLLALSPFLAAKRLLHYRDFVLGGRLTFMRGYAYTILMFFYSGLLLAAAVYVYFAFIDKGYLTGTLSHLLSTPAGRQAAEQYGMSEQLADGLRLLSQTRPIDFAFNTLFSNIFAGLLLGLPIAAFSRREVSSQRKNP